MTSGKKYRIPWTQTLIALALVTAPTLEATSSVAATSVNVDSELTPAALIASLAQPAPAHTKFTEVRYLAMLDAPMVLRGTLSWFGGDHLQRSVELPFSEVTDIREGEVTVQREGEPPAHFSLHRAPELEGLLGSFESLLSGNSKSMLETFAVELKGDEAHWKLVLDPRDKRLKKHVLGLVVYGAGNKARCMRMDEADGDLSITLLGALASMTLPKSPKAAALIGHCTADAVASAKRASGAARAKWTPALLAPSWRSPSGPASLFARAPARVVAGVTIKVHQGSP